MARRYKRIAPGLIGFFCVFGFILACPFIFLYLQKNPESAQPPPQDPTQKTQTLEQINRDLLKQGLEQQQSREWVLIKNGKIEEAIQIHERADPRRDSKKRTNILRAMGKLTRNEDSKALRVLDFLMEVLRKDSPHLTTERLTSAHALVEIGRVLPTHRPRIEAALMEFYNQETRPGPKGKTLQLLAELNGSKGFDFVTQISKNETLDPAIENSLLYALNEYAKDRNRLEKTTQIMSQVASRQQRFAPLAVKLLALHQSPLAKKHVSALLQRDSDPAAIEAGAFAAGKLGLKEYQAKLQQLQQDTRLAPVAQTITQALNELSR